MTQYNSLLSIIFMMSFVILFDRVRDQGRTGRFWKTGLLSREELARIGAILSACQEGV